MRRIIVITLSLVAVGGCSFLLNDNFSGGDAASSGLDSGAADSTTSRGSDDGGGPADASVDQITLADAYFNAVIADKPLSYWRLDETQGPVLRDAMGRHDLTITNPLGTMLAQTSAVHGTSVTLDGDARLVLSGTLDLSSGRAFTVEAWIRPADTSDVFRRIFGKIAIGAGGPVDGTYLWVNGARSTLGFESWRDKSSVDAVYWYVRPPNDSFSHVVIVVDGVRTKFYANGDLVDTASQSPGTAANPDVEVLWGEKFIGGLDELAFYEKPLGAERVKAHYDAAKK